MHAAVAAPATRRRAASRLPIDGWSLSNTASSRFDTVSSGPNNRKLRCPSLAGNHVAQKPAEHARVFRVDCAGLVNVDGVVAEIGQPQIAQQQAAVGVRIGAHASVADRRQRRELAV